MRAKENNAARIRTQDAAADWSMTTWTYGLARRWVACGVTANVLDPGIVKGKSGSEQFEGPALMGVLMSHVIPFFAAAGMQRGAQQYVRLAADPALATVSGTYFVSGKEKKAAAPPCPSAPPCRDASTTPPRQRRYVPFPAMLPQQADGVPQHQVRLGGQGWSALAAASARPAVPAASAASRASSAASASTGEPICSPSSALYIRSPPAPGQPGPAAVRRPPRRQARARPPYPG
jgi:hypothetical protein